jgi:hypothetical protein
MALKKLTYDDALMLETIVDALNELMEESEYTNKRISRLWKYLRIGEKKDKEVKKTKKEGGE